jgi:hypothetical protein
VRGGVGAESADSCVRKGGEAACETARGRHGGLRLPASRLPCAGEAVGEVRAGGRACGRGAVQGGGVLASMNYGG